MIARVIYVRAMSALTLNSIMTNTEIPDEEALDPDNPEYSCITCNDQFCPDKGRRFCSCPDHIKKEE